VPRLCRLQYRTRDSSGQRSQHDDLFEIRGEEVKPLPDDTAEKFRHLFLGSAE
jgi:hypothetical protein